MDTQATRLVVVALNGVFVPTPRLLAILERAATIIAADGGANWLVAQGYLPDLLVGDMDSVLPHVLAAAQGHGCSLQRYPTAKDETDAELALAAAVQREPEEIAILGALGGRIDHALANLALLTMPVLSKVTVRIWDEASTLWLAEGETEILGAPGDTVSLIPWGGDALGIVTAGLAYPLRGETLSVGPSRGVSNVQTGPRAQVTLQAGRLLVVHTPTAEGEDPHVP